MVKEEEEDFRRSDEVDLVVGNHQVPGSGVSAPPYVHVEHEAMRQENTLEMILLTEGSPFFFAPGVALW